MKSEAEYWKQWWNEQARHASSDYALNRRTSVRVQALEDNSMRQFLGAVNPQAGDRVLDAGCGSGRNISVLSPLVSEIVGLDYSEEMIKRTSERIAAERLTNAKAMVGDITRLSFAADTFDKVVCASVLQYVDEAACASALQELVRVCKPGGRLVLHLKNGTSLYGLSLVILRPIARVFGKQMKPEYYRSRKWHEAILAQYGATVLDYDGFGILTFVPLPPRVVGSLIETEMRLPVPKFLKRFAVNYKATFRIAKSAKSRG